MRSGRIAIACLASLIIVFACVDRPGAERLQGVDASMAAGGPTPDQCDTKSLPTRDYFQDKDDLRAATSLLRDLSDACDSEDQPSAYDIGFDLLGRIEAARAAGGASDAVAYAGGELVEGIWTAMKGAGLACDASIFCNEDEVVPDPLEVKKSLMAGGAFGVRSDGDTTTVAVYSKGGPPPEFRWGVEPATSWAVLPLGPTQSPEVHRALIYGYPSDDGFDWSVTPWYTNPWDDKDRFLLVGNCAETGQNVPFVSHVASLLPPGPPLPSYCSSSDDLLALGFGARVVRTVSSLLPFWPQTLHAAAGGSSGNAREFSPFFRWDIPADALTEISEPYGGPTPVGKTICFEFDCGPFTFEWTTQEDGLILATRETFRIFTTDNNGATVDFEPGWEVVGSGVECPKDGPPNTQTGRNEITCTIDRREGIGEPDQGIELWGLALNKPGVYGLCVESVGDDFGSGLNIAACTENFHISPNP